MLCKQLSILFTFLFIWSNLIAAPPTLPAHIQQPPNGPNIRQISEYMPQAFHQRGLPGICGWMGNTAYFSCVDGSITRIAEIVIYQDGIVVFGLKNGRPSILQTLRVNLLNILSGVFSQNNARPAAIVPPAHGSLQQPPPNALSLSNDQLINVIRQISQSNIAAAQRMQNRFPAPRPAPPRPPAFPSVYPSAQYSSQAYYQRPNVAPPFKRPHPPPPRKNTEKYPNARLNPKASAFFPRPHSASSAASGDSSELGTDSGKSGLLDKLDEISEEEFDITLDESESSEGEEKKTQRAGKENVSDKPKLKTFAEVAKQNVDKPVNALSQKKHVQSANDGFEPVPDFVPPNPAKSAPQPKSIENMYKLIFSNALTEDIDSTATSFSSQNSKFQEEDDSAQESLDEGSVENVGDDEYHSNRIHIVDRNHLDSEVEYTVKNVFPGLTRKLPDAIENGEVVSKIVGKLQTGEDPESYEINKITLAFYTASAYIEDDYMELKKHLRNFNAVVDYIKMRESLTSNNDKMGKIKFFGETYEIDEKGLEKLKVFVQNSEKPMIMFRETLLFCRKTFSKLEQYRRSHGSEFLSTFSEIDQSRELLDMNIRIFDKLQTILNVYTSKLNL